MDFSQLCDECQLREAKQILAQGAEAADQTGQEARWQS
jgi:hypothetical protein